MKFLTPAYYNSFKCKAQNCTDNCCIGWEICIDSDTAEFYKTIDGTLGKRLKENITFGDEPSFILQGERCPFLNEKGLCDIISDLGENALCQICRDHPRFFEWYGDIKEGGIGLSCEEGARLILNCGDYLNLNQSETGEWVDEDFESQVYSSLFKKREQLFHLLLSDVPFSEKSSKMLGLPQGKAFSFDSEIKKALLFLEETEQVNDLWKKKFSFLKDRYLKKNPSKLITDEKDEKYLCNLTSYFLWRYFMKSAFDGDVKGKIRLALFSAAVIFAIVCLENERDESDWIKASVLFSKQMEYSDENIEKFYKTY
ncbi:MAG: flagellin lysine-N-methylase [Acutalibacteraceae bacterium]